MTTKENLSRTGPLARMMSLCKAVRNAMAAGAVPWELPGPGTRPRQGIVVEGRETDLPWLATTPKAILTQSPYHQFHRRSQNDV